MTLPGTPQQNTARTMSSALKRRVTCMVVGLTLLLMTCLMLLPSDDRPPTEAVTGPTIFMHRTVERQLIDGRLSEDSKENKSWALWAGDPKGSRCLKYKTRFGVNLPRVWLLSFPSSGNTWTRYLLEAASGIFTGSVYVDENLIKNGFLGGKEKFDSRRTIVQKTHIPTVLRHEHSSLKQYQATNASFPTVLLLRNPANAIISYYKFMVRKSHTEQIPDSQFKTKKFRTFVEKAVAYWMELAVNSLLWTEAPLHVLYYEHLVEEPLKELRSVLAFLRVPEDEGRMACIAEHLEGKFKRKGNKNIDPYTVQEKTSMAAAARAVNRTLQLLGYAPLPSYN